ncbi:MAG: VOC family protein [Actinomycetota bacterium]
MAINPIPEGYPRVSPYLYVNGGNEALDFYTKVFGAAERARMPGPDGKIMHAELEVGDSIIMLSDEFEQFGNRSPRSIGGTPVLISVYVEDVDETFNRAVEMGAKSIQPVQDQFYGDRSGQFEDPFGHRWSVASHIEDVSPEEMAKRAAQYGSS